MKFWLGTHRPNWLETERDLFVSRRRLYERKTLPVAVGPWALDSGGFTELNMHGAWLTTEDEYVADVRRFEDEIGNLAWAAPMDWMCEPFVLAKTGLTIEEHQLRTVLNFMSLRERLGSVVIPVLQGWTVDDYHRCAEMYDENDVDLSNEPLIGVGSVCRRQNTQEAADIFRSLLPLKLHGFGVKVAGIEKYADALTSADSMSWSSQARWVSGDDQQPSLFNWPRRTLCGKLHPTEHKAKTCANCLDWALAWRDQILESIENWPEPDGYRQEGGLTVATSR